MSNLEVNTVVLHNHKSGNNLLAAEMISKSLKCDIAAAEDLPDLTPYQRVVFVVPNTGDEELPQNMEDLLSNLQLRNRDYLICELGNYFGLETYCGCKKIIFQILDQLNWKRISDISIDSLPTIDIQELLNWIDFIKSLAYTTD